MFPNTIAPVRSMRRALWIREEPGFFYLMAKTSPQPVMLPVSRDGVFEVRILRIPPGGGEVYARPQVAERYVEKLSVMLDDEARKKNEKSTVKEIDSRFIYLAITNDVWAHRVALLEIVAGSEWNTLLTMYDIDTGEVLRVSRENVFRLPYQLRGTPPLAFRAIFNFRHGDVNTVRLGLANFEVDSTRTSWSLKSAEGYFPPAVYCRSLEAIENDKFEQKGSTRTCMQEYISLGEGFSFDSFSSAYRALLHVCVTEELSNDVYLVRDVSIIEAVSKYMVLPTKRLSPILFMGKTGVPCIVHLMEPIITANHSFFPGLYRGMVKDYNAIMAMFTISLVDFGQEVTCPPFNVFSIREQPWVIFATQAASFKLHVTNPVRSNGEVSKLEIGTIYGVCLVEQSDDTFEAIIKTIVQLDTKQTNAAALGNGNNEMESGSQCQAYQLSHSICMSQPKLTSETGFEGNRDVLLPQESKRFGGPAESAKFPFQSGPRTDPGFRNSATLEQNAAAPVAASGVSVLQQSSGSASDFAGCKRNVICETCGLRGHCSDNCFSTVASGSNAAADQFSPKPDSVPKGGNSK